MAIFPAAIYFRNNSLSYGILRQDPNTGIPSAVGILFDLVLAETHTRNSYITDRPVEEGTIISDHIKNDIEQAVLTGQISNFSIFRPGLTSNRAQDAFDELEKLWKERQLITFATVLKVYDNVAITSLSIDRDENSGEETTATISFRKVNKVKLKTVEITAGINAGSLDNDNSKQASSKADLGRQIGVTF